jgi:peptide-methionine (R)-S-oxide reductase
MVEKLIRSDKEWRRILPPGRYGVLFKNGTEPPFDNEYNNFWKPGIYCCYACDLPLFSSEAKFHSSSGWPSFWQPISPDAIEEHVDRSLWMRRTAVSCARCGGHLGHVFSDGPPPTGLRYCMNSASLKFAPD